MLSWRKALIARFGINCGNSKRILIRSDKISTKITAEAVSNDSILLSLLVELFDIWLYNTFTSCWIIWHQYIYECRWLSVHQRFNFYTFNSITEADFKHKSGEWYRLEQKATTYIQKEEILGQGGLWRQTQNDSKTCNSKACFCWEKYIGEKWKTNSIVKTCQ